MSKTINGTITRKGFIGGIWADHATAADTAKIALYASNDTTKGTIEERLSGLGFKATNITVLGKAGFLIQREANFVIANWQISDITAEKNDENFTDGVLWGTIPEGFRPKNSQVIHFGIQSGETPVAIGKLTINTDGTLIYSSSSLWNVNVAEGCNLYISFGYES